MEETEENIFRKRGKYYKEVEYRKDDANADQIREEEGKDKSKTTKNTKYSMPRLATTDIYKVKGTEQADEGKMPASSVPRVLV